MDKHFLKTAAVFAAVLAMTACSDAPKTETKTEEAKKEPPAPTEPVPAKTAFYEMYRPARSWATDLQVLSLTSGEIEGFKNTDGKAAMWTVVFVSPSRNEARTVTYSIADHGTVQKGVTMAGAARWSGPAPKSQPFPTTDFQVNSDEAYKTALPKAASFLKQHPDKPVWLFLGKQAKFPGPAWYVQWGDTKMGYAVYVNATTGDVMK
jgi:hypothetical protein